MNAIIELKDIKRDFLVGNDVGLNEADFRGGQNRGETLAGE